MVKMNTINTFSPSLSTRQVKPDVFSASVCQRPQGRPEPFGGRALTGAEAPAASSTNGANVNTVKRTDYMVLFSEHLKGSGAPHLGSVDYILRITVLEG